MAGAAAAQVEVRSVDQELFPGEAERVHVDLSFGALTVEGTAGRNIEVELVLLCNRQDLEICRKRAERIRLVPRMRGGELNVRLKRTPRGRMRGIRARMRVRMPRQLALEVDVRSGHVSVLGMDSDVEIDGGTGDVDLVHSRDRIGTVEVDVAFGHADLWLPESRVEGTGFPRSLTWHGSGTSRINIDLTKGDVAVRLE